MTGPKGFGMKNHPYPKGSEASQHMKIFIPATRNFYAPEFVHRANKFGMVS